MEIVDLFESMREPNAESWIVAMIDNLEHKKLVELVVTLWAIWTARRKAIQEGILQSPHATHSFVTSFIFEFENVQCSQRRVAPLVRHANSGSRGSVSC